MYRNTIKPFFDFMLSLTGLLIMSPLFFVIVILLLIFQNGQVFFIQKRPGCNEKIFSVIKFKTMIDVFDSDGKLLPDEQRLTKIGSFLRKTSLDEIPQLINVIKGDMSIVGPRPWLIEYLDLYTDDQRNRHNVKPGITGWAQIHGRNQLNWDKRFEYDLYYVKNQSFILDLKILFLTIFKVFRAEGISSKDHVTMKKFKGNKKV